MDKTIIMDALMVFASARLFKNKVIITNCKEDVLRKYRSQFLRPGKQM